MLVSDVCGGTALMACERGILAKHPPGRRRSAAEKAGSRDLMPPRFPLRVQGQEAPTTEPREAMIRCQAAFLVPYGSRRKKDTVVA